MEGFAFEQWKEMFILLQLPVLGTLTIRQVPVCVLAALHERDTLPATMAWSLCNCCRSVLESKDNRQASHTLIYLLVKQLFASNSRAGTYEKVQRVKALSLKLVTRNIFNFTKFSHVLALELSERSLPFPHLCPYTINSLVLSGKFS